MAAVIGFPYSGWKFFSVKPSNGGVFRLWRWIRVECLLWITEYRAMLLPCCCFAMLCWSLFRFHAFISIFFMEPPVPNFQLVGFGEIFIFFSASNIDYWRRCIYFLLHPESGISIAQANRVEASLEDKAEKLRVKNGFCERDHCLVRKRCKTRSFLFCCLWVGEGGASCFVFFFLKVFVLFFRCHQLLSNSSTESAECRWSGFTAGALRALNLSDGWVLFMLWLLFLLLVTCYLLLVTCSCCCCSCCCCCCCCSCFRCCSCSCYLLLVTCYLFLLLLLLLLLLLIAMENLSRNLFNFGIVGGHRKVVAGQIVCIFFAACSSWILVLRHHGQSAQGERASIHIWELKRGFPLRKTLCM